MNVAVKGLHAERVKFFELHLKDFIWGFFIAHYEETYGFNLKADSYVNLTSGGEKRLEHEQ